MFRTAAKQHAGGCVMVARRVGEKTIDLIGTGFLCHGKGYVLTAAHIFSLTDRIGFVPPAPIHQFNPSQLTNFSFIEATVAQYDAAHDVALLKISESTTVKVPPNLLGTDDLAQVGASVCYLGFPHAHNGQHALKVSGSVLSSKVISSSETKQFVLDSMVEACNSGGPLIDIASGRIIGVISGRFSPTGGGGRGGVRIGSHLLGTESTISYATAISHALALLEAEGLHE